MCLGLGLRRGHGLGDQVSHAARTRQNGRTKRLRPASAPHGGCCSSVRCSKYLPLDETLAQSEATSPLVRVVLGRFKSLTVSDLP